MKVCQLMKVESLQESSCEDRILYPVHHMTPPQDDGYSRSLGQFGSTVVNIQQDVQDLELSFSKRRRLCRNYRQA
ncbi:MAG: hypothetical protein JO356_13990 [Acidobacteria bacterium]|nr:hypothetical protein [Acidobacteriota bacterium]